LAHVGLTLYTFRRVSTRDPGAINQSNVDQYSNLYPYDNMIYEKKFCETCKIDRPARSKHCSICKRCVSRFDHHCAWINTDVGLHNIREFLIFLLATASLTSYATYMIYYIEKGILVANNLLEYTYQDANGVTKSLSWGYLFQVLVVHTAPVVGLGMFCVVVTLVLFTFLGYHMWLIKENTTTNETFKWKDLKYELKLQDQFVKRSEAEGRRVDPKQLRPFSLKDVKNIYDRGWRANFREALFPGSLAEENNAFEDALTRGASSPSSSSSPSKPSGKKNGKARK
jgi:palmitoyltransferase ZDHHC4